VKIRLYDFKKKKRVFTNLIIQVLADPRIPYRNSEVSGTPYPFQMHFNSKDLQFHIVHVIMDYFESLITLQSNASFLP
jgi:transposase